MFPSASSGFLATGGGGGPVPPPAATFAQYDLTLASNDAEVQSVPDQFSEMPNIVSAGTCVLGTGGLNGHNYADLVDGGWASGGPYNFAAVLDYYSVVDFTDGRFTTYSHADSQYAGLAVQSGGSPSYSGLALSSYRIGGTEYANTLTQGDLSTIGASLGAALVLLRGVGLTGFRLVRPWYRSEAANRLTGKVYEILFMPNGVGEAEALAYFSTKYGIAA